LTTLASHDLEHVIANTPDIWGHLRSRRLFVTGGTGFFGVWLMESLLRANDELALGLSVVVLSRHPAAFKRKAPHIALHPAVTLHGGDIRSFEFPKGAFSHVIHFAANSRTKHVARNPQVMIPTIVDGTARVLEFAANAGVEKYLLASSGGVYGRIPSGVRFVTETLGSEVDPMDTLSDPSGGKRAAELMSMIAANQHGFDATIARCFAFVGPHLPLDGAFAIGNFIRETLNGDPIHITGDGSPRRSYMYAADLAIWLLTILVKGQSARPYNVGSEHDVSIYDTAVEVRRIVNPASDIIVDKQRVEGAPIQSYVPSTERARTELGLRELVPLAGAIERTAAWHQANCGV
jgi:dTDP-glucose 4,6-dehydratase